jgi:hypothetical protein
MESTKCSIQIISKDKINPIFLKANAKLLEKNINILDENVEHTLLKLKETWKTEYQVDLDISAGLTNAVLIFNNELAMTSFLLRWS